MMMMMEQKRHEEMCVCVMQHKPELVPNDGVVFEMVSGQTKKSSQNSNIFNVLLLTECEPNSDVCIT